MIVQLLNMLQNLMTFSVLHLDFRRSLAKEKIALLVLG